MVVITTVLIVAILIAAIWIFIEVKRFKHKILAYALIALVLFSYLGFVGAVKGEEIDYKSVEGLKMAGQLYFSWLGNAFTNVKTLSGNAVKMDWSGDNSSTQG